MLVVIADDCCVLDIELVLVAFDERANYVSALICDLLARIRSLMGGLRSHHLEDSLGHHRRERRGRGNMWRTLGRGWLVC